MYYQISGRGNIIADEISRLSLMHLDLKETLQYHLVLMYEYD